MEYPLMIVWRPLLVAAIFAFLCAPPVEAERKSPAVGMVPPDFKAKNAVTGEELRLSAQQGKVVVLTFWATWCGPCRRELPILENVQRKVGKDRLVVFAVAFHESSDNFRALKKMAGTWQLALIEDWNGRIADQYAIDAIPHLFIIGREGKILAVHTGYGEGSIDELVTDINAAFMPASPPDGSESKEAQ
jgi:thiol-disulfide isomerase/thioredoxin